MREKGGGEKHVVVGGLLMLEGGARDEGAARWRPREHGVHGASASPGATVTMLTGRGPLSGSSPFSFSLFISSSV